MPMLFLLLALASPASTGAERTVRLDQLGTLKPGVAAPWFAGWTLQDQVLNRTRLLKSKHRAHALVFFATWCTPCVRGLKMLQAQRADWQAAELNVVLVNFREAPETIRPFLAKHGLSDLPVMLDKFGQVAQAFGVSDGRSARLPRSIVMDADGKMRAFFGAEGPDYVPALIEAARPRK
jgi:peroxiredoxin